MGSLNHPKQGTKNSHEKSTLIEVLAISRHNTHGFCLQVYAEFGGINEGLTERYTS